MKWIISHQSALEFWRKTDLKKDLVGAKVRTIKPPAQPLDVKQLKKENFWNLTIPLHVLVGSDNARKTYRNLHSHIYSGELPKESFFQMPSGMIVCAPELCFFQMAGELSFTDLLVLGYEFCGSYRLHKKGTAEQDLRADLPLTNISKLISYAAKTADFKGRKNAIKVLRFIINGSASPMETILTILLTLPYKYGGYGFPKPQLNYRIDVHVKTGNSTRIMKYRCDLYWPDAQLDVEYDSDAFHTGSERISKDAIRRNNLASTGVTVVTVSKDQIAGTRRLRDLAMLLSKHLGKRIKCKNKEFISRNIKLMVQLSPKVECKTTQEKC